MRTSAAVAAAVLASGASAQFIPTSSSTLSLLNSLTQLLTPTCRQTVLGLVSPNSTFAQCLNLEDLVPALTNNGTSIVPNIDAYLRSTCAQPACSAGVLQNATQQVSTACARDFGSFNIDANITQYFAEYYETGRDVLCLSTNETSLLPTSFPGNTSTAGNNTETVLCPTSLLEGLESYLGTPLSNQFIINTALGANATAYRQLLAIPRNATLIRQFACNDCVTGSLEIVLEDVPQLRNQSIITLPTAQLNNFTGLGVDGNRSEWSLPQFYDAVCDVDLSNNGTLPASINETAYDNTTSTIRPSATSSVATIRSSASARSSSAAIPTGPIASYSTVISSAAASATGFVTSAAGPAVSVVSSVVGVPTASSPVKRRFVRWD